MRMNAASCMKRAKYCLIIALFAACASPPKLIVYLVDPGVRQYFMPPTDWASSGATAKARLDITYRTGEETPAIVNISFIGKKAMPGRIGSVSINGAGISCPLDNITVLFPDPKNNEVRITSEADRDLLIAVLGSEPIAITAEIGGATQTFTPGKQFISIKNDLLIAASY